jgi:hypothetical protein
MCARRPVYLILLDFVPLIVIGNEFLDIYQQYILEFLINFM